MAKTSMKQLTEDYLRSLEKQLHGWGEVTTIAQIQRESGLLHFDWPGSYSEYKRPDEKWWKRDFPMFSEEYEKRDILPPIDLVEAVEVLINMRINQAECKHDEKEETGESIPMGTFTSRPSRCQRCGLKFHDD